MQDDNILTKKMLAGVNPYDPTPITTPLDNAAIDTDRMRDKLLGIDDD